MFTLSLIGIIGLIVACFTTIRNHRLATMIGTLNALTDSTVALPAGQNTCVYVLNAGVTAEHYLIYLTLAITTYILYFLLTRLVHKYWITRVMAPINDTISVTFTLNSIMANMFVFDMDAQLQHFYMT